jgi:hypothetical protein
MSALCFPFECVDGAMALVKTSISGIAGKGLFDVNSLNTESESWAWEVNGWVGPGGLHGSIVV